MASSDLLEAPRSPIEMKVFQGGGGQVGGGAAASDMYVTPSHPIEMKVFQGGGQPEAGNLSRNMKTFLETRYAQALLAKPPLEYKVGKTYSAGLIVVDFSGKVALAQRAGDAQAGLLGPGVGHIDPEDTTVEGLRPGLVAAIRETQEELGVNALQPEYIKTADNKISKTAINNLVNKNKKDRFCLIYSNGGGEKSKGGMEIYYTVEQRASYYFSDKVTGPMPNFKDEVNTAYKFQEFKTKPAKVDVKGNTGVGFVELDHCITVLEANKETIGKGGLTIKILNILKCIQDNHTAKDIETAIQKYLNENFDNEYNKILANLKKFGKKKAVKFVKGVEGTLEAEGDGGAKGGDEGGAGAKGGVGGAGEEDGAGAAGEEDGGDEGGAGAKGGDEGGEADGGDEGGTNKAKGGNEASENSSKKPEKEKEKPTCEEGEMLLLSGVYRIPCVTDDEEQKERIQDLDFEEDEELFFKNELHFDHPFIRQYLQSEEIKEDWYEFWKLYVNYDASDKFTLLTWEEGKTIQRFRNRVWKAYQKYLLEGALTFLLKTKSPVALYEYLHPPETKAGILFEVPEKEEEEEEEEEEYVPENDHLEKEVVKKRELEGGQVELTWDEEEAAKDKEESKKPIKVPSPDEVETEEPLAKPVKRGGPPILDILYWEGDEEYEKRRPEGIPKKRVPSTEERQERFIQRVKGRLDTDEYKENGGDVKKFNYLNDLYRAIRSLRTRTIAAPQLRDFMRELMDLPPGSRRLFVKAKKKIAPDTVHHLILDDPDISVEKIVNIFFNIDYSEFMNAIAIDKEGNEKKKGDYFRDIEGYFLKYYESKDNENGFAGLIPSIREHLRNTNGKVDWNAIEEAAVGAGEAEGEGEAEAAPAPAPAAGGGWRESQKKSRKKRITRHKNPKQKKRISKRKSKSP